jgi:hypothetical protein
MENQAYESNNMNLPAPQDDSKNTIIILLLVLLVLSFLGISFVQTIATTVGPYLSGFFSILGYTTGSVIDETADIVGGTAKTGIDITQGAFQDIGNIFKQASQGQVPDEAKSDLDHVLNVSPISPKPLAPSQSENPIQKPISANKMNWCLIGEYQERRGCIEVGEQDKCMSGQVFPTQRMCLNPNLTP